MRAISLGASSAVLHYSTLVNKHIVERYNYSGKYFRYSSEEFGHATIISWDNRLPNYNKIVNK